MEGLQFEPIPSADTAGVNVGETVEVSHFRHPIISAKYVTRKGKTLDFVNHIYTTADADEITELRDEAKNIGFLEAKDKYTLEELTDPMAALRRKLRAELLAEMAQESARVNNHSNDAGTSVNGPLKTANAAGLNSGAVSTDAILSAQASQQNAGGVQTYDVSAMLAKLKK